MPVQMIRVTAADLKASPQYQEDLLKIYSEAEPRRRVLDQEPLSPEAFIAQALGDSCNHFAAALFNDHLIGAVLVSVAEKTWLLHHLCVREVTRRRGVGTRLMALVAAAGREADARVGVPLQGLTVEDQMLVRRLGYSLDDTAECFFICNP